MALSLMYTNNDGSGMLHLKPNSKRVNKACRLQHINCFSEITMKKGVLDVHLLHIPLHDFGKMKHCSNCSRAYYRTIGFKVYMGQETMSWFLHSLTFLLSLLLSNLDPLELQ